MLFFFFALSFVILLYFFLGTYQPGSNAILLLLKCVDAALEGVLLEVDSPSVTTLDLKKHHDAVQAAAEQHLYSLDIVLETYRLIATRLECLNMALNSSVDQTSSLLGKMQVSTEASTSLPSSLLLFVYF